MTNEEMRDRLTYVLKEIRAGQVSYCKEKLKEVRDALDRRIIDEAETGPNPGESRRVF